MGHGSGTKKLTSNKCFILGYSYHLRFVQVLHHHFGHSVADEREKGRGIMMDRTDDMYALQSWITCQLPSAFDLAVKFKFQQLLLSNNPTWGPKIHALLVIMMMMMRMSVCSWAGNTISLLWSVNTKNLSRIKGSVWEQSVWSYKHCHHLPCCC